MSKISILAEFAQFLKKEKKWWLLPIVVCLLVAGLFLIATSGSVLAPFIYALF